MTSLSSRSLGNNPTKVIYPGGATTTATIAAGMYMTLSLVSQCVTYGKKASPLIIGPDVKGKHMNGVIVMCPDQAFDLSERDAKLAQAQREAQSAAMTILFSEPPSVFIRIRQYTITREWRRPSNWGARANLPGATALFLGIQPLRLRIPRRKFWRKRFRLPELK